MPVLAPNQELRSRAPSLTVENDLAPGRWRFRLVVVDDDGVESKPAELIVTVRAPPSPPPRPGPTPTPGGPRPQDAVIRERVVRPVDERVRRVILPPR
jgi:hypothetical protein